MPPPSSEQPPSSSSRPSYHRLMTRSALASFTSPSLALSEPSPSSPSVTKRRGFSVERIYEFEAPQFYDFTKQSDPERGNLEENWFDLRRRTPSSPEFHFMARTSSSATAIYRPKSASGKLNFSGSNGGLSFMNTPIGRGQNFVIPSSVGKSSVVSFKARAGLKKSATTENVTNCLLSSDATSSDPPSTIIRSVQKRFREFGSDERKIISGFMSTPLLVIKTPSNSRKDKDIPRSPLQKITKKSSSLAQYSTDESSLLVRETSSIEESVNMKSNETLLIEETSHNEPIDNNGCNNKDNNNEDSNNAALSHEHSSSAVLSSRNSSVLVHTDSSLIPNSSIIPSTSGKLKNDYENFQANVKARINEDRQRIEAQAALQARKIQKLKAGPTHLPTKSTKPLTIPKSFQFGCDQRAQQKKKLFNQSQLKTAVTNVQTSAKVTKPAISQKFVPTIPKSPLFASKLRAASKSKESNNPNNANTTDTINTTNITQNNNSKLKENNPSDNTNNPTSTAAISDLRRKFEFRPMVNNVTIPKSPKLSSIHRNRRTINKN